MVAFNTDQSLEFFFSAAFLDPLIEFSFFSSSKTAVFSSSAKKSGRGMRVSMSKYIRGIELPCLARATRLPAHRHPHKGSLSWRDH